ncbi:MAG TPA: hypothetical protein VGO24_00350 [Solirubrobacterales bacterium]|nr:hypothetical protein [Solirubrobacterales bacterium]
MKRLIAGGLGVLCALVLAPAALAASHHPTGEYAQFDECPLNRATITDCNVSITEGGSFKIGSKTVPIVHPVKLQGGFEGAGSEIKFYGAENGDTLSKTAQPVPGGLTGITAPAWWPALVKNWFNALLSEGLTGVDATLELAGPTKGLTTIKLNTENLIFEEGTALGLPSKIHLENAILGPNCYIGTSSNPVNINLTTATSGGLKGSAGTITFNEPFFTITTVTGARLVDGTFPAPGTTGCGGLFALFVNPLISTFVGLPASSGNHAIFESGFQDAPSSEVIASE